MEIAKLPFNLYLIHSTIEKIYTCPLDFGVMIPPWKEDKEATEYDGQAC